MRDFVKVEIIEDDCFAEWVVKMGNNKTIVSIAFSTEEEAKAAAALLEKACYTEICMESKTVF
jgi:hypothetical protein